MYNLYGHIATNAGRCKSLTYGDSLFTVYNCGLQDKYADLWSHNNYIVYVAEGRKIWHTGHGSFDIREGSCVFVRKGAAIVEQFFDTEFCFFLFFLPDEFICDVLKNRSKPIIASEKRMATVMPIGNSSTVHAYFQSMLPYFEVGKEPDPSLLELKFRELVLMIAENPVNSEIISYFSSLLRAPGAVSLRQVMEENFRFNLKLEDFARLSMRSLSAFKRDFAREYEQPPGKWLLERRLNHALHLLTNLGKSVSETAFECGFENSSHFSRSFRQRFGMSPVSFRQQLTA